MKKARFSNEQIVTIVPQAEQRPEFAVQSLLNTPTVTIQDGCCQGTCRHQGAEECTATTQVVFPYRGVYVRHLGADQAVAEANQVVLFNATEGYRVSHPVPGGDASLTLVISEPQLRELAPRALLHASARGTAAAPPAVTPDALSLPSYANVGGWRSSPDAIPTN
jgi:hypothetical protein